MSRMTRPDCVVTCNLINTHTHRYTHTHLPPALHGLGSVVLLTDFGNNLHSGKLTLFKGIPRAAGVEPCIPYLGLHFSVSASPIRYFVYRTCPLLQ